MPRRLFYAWIPYVSGIIMPNFCWLGIIFLQTSHLLELKQSLLRRLFHEWLPYMLGKLSPSLVVRSCDITTEIVIFYFSFNQSHFRAVLRLIDILFTKRSEILLYCRTIVGRCKRKKVDVLGFTCFFHSFTTAKSWDKKLFWFSFLQKEIRVKFHVINALNNKGIEAVTVKATGSSQGK